MNVIHLNGDVFDLDQVVSQDVRVDCVRLRFRNGDEIPVYWRDDRERGEVLRAVSEKPTSA
jgi:hypothetical protein